MYLKAALNVAFFKGSLLLFLYLYSLDLLKTEWGRPKSLSSTGSIPFFPGISQSFCFCKVQGCVIHHRKIHDSCIFIVELWVLSFVKIKWLFPPMNALNSVFSQYLNIPVSASICLCSLDMSLTSPFILTFLCLFFFLLSAYLAGIVEFFFLFFVWLLVQSEGLNKCW